jgi:ribulose 1,5-bisphosphate synthetase/thiazole synthase
VEKSYSEPARKLPVVGEVDVLVAGGGVAGVSAAVSAARAGASVLLIERSGFLGGTGAIGMEYFGGFPYRHAQGFAKELCARLESEGALVVPEFSDSGTFFDAETLKYLLLKMMEEAGAKLKLYTAVSTCIMEGRRAAGVVIEGKSGRQAVMATTVVDATGDADVAAAAGCSFQKGREADSNMRPGTLLFRVGNMDFPALKRYVDSNPAQFAPGISVSCLDLERNVVRLFGFFDVAQQANKDGALDKSLHYIRLEGMLKSNSAIFNTTRIYDFDGTNTDDLTRGTYQGFEQARGIVAVLRERVPGFENATLMEYAPSIGVRETRMLVGRRVFQVGDVIETTYFDDSVCKFQGYGVPNHEQHSPDGMEGTKEHPQGEMDPRSTHPIGVYTYYIPYGMLLPVEADGLLVAGRCVSTTHLGNVWFRGMPSCMMTGQIAGVASSLAARSGSLVRDVDLEKLRDALAAQGVASRRY